LYRSDHRGRSHIRSRPPPERWYALRRERVG
jgi:hypothetical protein